MFIFIGIDTIHLIVAGHDGFCFPFFYCYLKSCEIDFPQGSLIQNRVHSHPPQFLGIHCEMLWAGKHALALNAFYIGRSHLPR